MSRVKAGERGRLPEAVLDWSLQSIEAHGDNDLFRSPFEFAVFGRNWTSLVKELADLRVDCYRWSKPRKLLLPRDRVSFRHASQLDPLDSLVLTALAKIVGGKVEARRQPRDIVFSSRFAQTGYSLYDTKSGWEHFWRSSQLKIQQNGAFVARTDIADFYNQVRHREILKRLEVCGIPDRLSRAFEGFLGAFSDGVGQGIPIGPHTGHLLAEISLSRVDELLKARNLRFNRYIDDFHIFCATEKEAQLALYDVADVLYPEFGLSLNRMKTSIVPKDEFLSEARKKSRDETTNQREEALLEAIRAVTGGDYDFASFEEILEYSPDAVSDETIEDLFDQEMTAERIDYAKVGWLLRRLSQVGAPGAVGYVLKHFEDFVPVIGDTAQYLARSGGNWAGAWASIGTGVLERAAHPIAAKSAYVEAMLLSLFAEQKELNHIDTLLAKFPTSAPAAKREIIMAARVAGSSDWLHSLRYEVDNLDSWSRRAFVYASSILPRSQQEECLRAIRSEAQGADSILLGALLAERLQSGGDLAYEPSGPAWPALVAQVPKERRELIEERFDELGEALQKEIRDLGGAQDLVVGTWNLRNFGSGAFGFGERLPESLLSIARVLLAFDLIAIQEIRDTDSVERLLTLLGTGWESVICGEAPGREGNSEMSAFLYRSSRVKFRGKVEQVILGERELILNKHQFARPPFVVHFVVGESKLTMCTAHTYFGSTRGPKFARRVAEIAALAKLVVHRAQVENSTGILLGDLNIVGPDDDTMKPLLKQQISLPGRLLRPTNVQGDKFYSQIAFRPTQEGPRLHKAGVFSVFDSVFRSVDIKTYRNEMSMTSAWETGKRGPAKGDLDGFYPKWRTFQISDHMPVWAHFAL